MSRRKAKASDAALLHPDLRVKVHIRNDTLGPGKMQLLALVAQTGSISAAARQMGLGYRRAWFLLETLQACFQQPLLITTRGGGGSGGAQLTETGTALVAQYQATMSDLDQAASGFLEWLESQQAATEPS